MPLLGRLGETGNPTKQLFNLDQALRDGDAGKLPIALATGNALRQYEVVCFKTEGDRPLPLPNPRRDLDPDQAPLPTCRSLGGLRSNSVGVIAVGAVEIRAVTQAPVDLLCLGRVVER